MGDLCKVSRAAISQQETCKEVIPLTKLNIYANFFNVSMDYILGLTNIKNYNFSKIELDRKIVGERLRLFRKEKK